MAAVAMATEVVVEETGDRWIAQCAELEGQELDVSSLPPNASTVFEVFETVH